MTYWTDIAWIIGAFVAGWGYKCLSDWIFGQDYVFDDPAIVILDSDEKPGQYYAKKDTKETGKGLEDARKHRQRHPARKMGQSV